MNKLSITFAQALLKKTQLDKETQERIYEVGLSAKSTDILESLLKRKDLSSELDQKLLLLDDVKLREAWIKKPGRKVADLEKLVKEEKRQKVLSKLAETKDLPADFYAAVFKKAQITTNVNLLTNASVDNVLKKDIVKALGKKMKPESNLLYDALASIKEDKELVKLMVTSTSSLYMRWQVFAALSDELKVELKNFAYEMLIEQTFDPAKRSQSQAEELLDSKSYYSSLAKSILQYTLKLYENDDVLDRKEIASLVKKTKIENLPKYDQLSSYAQRDVMSSYTDTIAKLEYNILEYKSTWPDFQTISTEDITAWIGKLTSIYDIEERTLVVQSLYTNPNASADNRRRLYSRLSPEFVSSIISDLNVDRSLWVDTLYLHNQYGNHVTNTIWDEVKKRVDKLDFVFAYFKKINYAYRNVIKILEATDSYSIDILKQLPIQFVTAALSNMTARYSSGELSADDNKLLDFLLEMLPEKQDWEAFAGLEADNCTIEEYFFQLELLK